MRVLRASVEVWYVSFVFGEGIEEVGHGKSTSAIKIAFSRLTVSYRLNRSSKMNKTC